MNEKLRTFAEINLDAVESNFNSLKSFTSDKTKLCAVIKADGYGHGAAALAEFLSEKADYFAVATADEAFELRKNGIAKPILILSYVHADLYEALINADISMTIFTSEQAEKLSAAAQKVKKNAHIHLAVDTGMSRIGFDLSEESVKAIKTISSLKSISLDGIFSHYACADSSDYSVTEEQTEKFNNFIAECEKSGISFPVRHICNSAAIPNNKQHFDMVRMGISLYGLYPSDEIDKSKITLIPAMTLKSHIIHIKEVKKGQGISYSHTFKADKNMRIATVCAGYADGYPRALSNTGRVLVCGQFANITGRVCMDQFMIDVSDIPNVKIDDEVILFGTDGINSITAEEIGKKSMSFNYEVVCSIARRVPRVYKKDGKTVKTINLLSGGEKNL